MIKINDCYIDFDRLTVEDATAMLGALKTKTTDEDLADNGRYFRESCVDLTQCRHSETGEYGNGADGLTIEILWNLYRRGRLEIKP